MAILYQLQLSVKRGALVITDIPRASGRSCRALFHPSPLAEWLTAACQKRELSWAEASRRAGLHQGAISAYVRGKQPGLDACKALSSFFQVPLEYVLQLDWQWALNEKGNDPYFSHIVACFGADDVHIDDR